LVEANNGTLRFTGGGASSGTFHVAAGKALDFSTA
jgi:hypothetical protein